MKHIFLSAIACLLLTAAHSQGYKMEAGVVQPDGTIVFEKGSAKLKPESDAALGNIKKYLDDKSSISLLRVEGHVDGTGNTGQSLSEARARAVCAWLVANGIDCKRLIAVGFGGTKPAYPGSNIPANTRIVFANAALRGHLIGGMPADGGGNPAGDVCKQ